MLKRSNPLQRTNAHEILLDQSSLENGYKYMNEMHLRIPTFAKMTGRNTPTKKATPTNNVLMKKIRELSVTLAFS